MRSGQLGVSSPLERCLALFSRPPLPLYLFIMNLVILALLFPALMVVLQTGYKSFRARDLDASFFQMRQGLEDNIASLMQSMLATSAYAIGSYEFFLLQQQAAEVAESDQRIEYLVLMDRQGVAVVHADEAQVLSRLNSPMDRRALDIMMSEIPVEQPEGYKATVRFFSNEGEADGFDNPLIEGLIPIYSAGTLWGALRCGHRLKPLLVSIEKRKQEWSREISRFNLFLYQSMAGAAILAGLTALFFSWGLTRSTARLAAGVETITQGDLSQEISLALPSCQEFCSLSDGFNRMTGSLRQARQQLDEYSFSLEKKVEERTRELQEAQAELLRQAREAGMAEMAIGVLHNIGNAITPAKVDVNMLIGEIEDNPMRQELHHALHPIHSVLAKTREVSEEERARLLRLLELLPTGLEEEYDHIGKTLCKIREKHSHIEEIVMLQMRYASLGNGEEMVEVNRVVDDALRMLADSLYKRRIKVETMLADLPRVNLEHARLMQIIVNVIKNAYEAIDFGPNAGQGKITVASERNGEQVRLVVRDNGQGFDQEQKKKLFRFGYTTKERGSGFGLHSAANYLIARQGSITMNSPGPGLGAEVVVDLPTQKM